MRWKIFGIAIIASLVALALLATTAVVGAEDESDEQLVFDLQVTNINPPGPISNLGIGEIRVTEGKLFSVGEAGGPDAIGAFKVSQVSTKPVGEIGTILQGAFEFFGEGIFFTANVIPNPFGRVSAITGGIEEFRGASGECKFAPVPESQGVVRGTCELNDD